MFHVEHPTFSTMTFFLVFSHTFQATQERIPIVGFSACGIIPFRRMAIPAEFFYVIGRTFLWHKKLIPGEKIGNLYRATPKMLLDFTLIQNHVYKKSSSH